jgi:hypothetical protein
MHSMVSRLLFTDIVVVTAQSLFTSIQSLKSSKAVPSTACAETQQSISIGSGDRYVFVAQLGLTDAG